MLEAHALVVFCSVVILVICECLMAAMKCLLVFSLLLGCGGDGGLRQKVESAEIDPALTGLIGAYQVGKVATQLDFAHSV